MARWLYTVFYYLITPLILLRLFYRSRKAPAYGKRLGERFGFFKAPAATSGIWLHSVSVGETIAAVPLVRRLQSQYPHLPITITTMTPTGSERVRALFGDSVFHVYAPYDLPTAIGRFLRRVKPRLMIIMETELWPNTLHCCQRRGIPTLLVNARLSAKSAAGYQRLSALSRPMLGDLSKVLAQTSADAERFMGLGLAGSRVAVSGNIKFDINVTAALREQALQLKRQWSNDGQRLILIAASTHEGEDLIILQAFKQLLAGNPRVLLVLVPRHPERFDSVCAMVAENGLGYQRRSQQPSPTNDAQVFVGDSMGELMLFFGCSDIALVGGSLVNKGGHNMLEPAAWSIPLITGQSDFNFAEASRLLQQCSAMWTVANSQQLLQCWQQLLDNPQLRLEAGANAYRAIKANQGVLDRLMKELAEHL